MIGLLRIIGLLASISLIRASYNGPFILWGRDELTHSNVNSLIELNEKLLRDIYSDSSAIILFVRNASSHLSEENFPLFKDLLSKTSYVYSAQQYLGVDPMEFNLNAEVINLVGPTSQQDVELSALYRDAIITYGEGRVLGILATKTSDHEMRKRAVTNENQEIQSTPSAPNPVDNTGSEKKNQTDFVYYGTNPQNNILLYTFEQPSLFDGNSIIPLSGNESDTLITTSWRDQNQIGEQRRLKVQYKYKEKLAIEYVFNISGEYWTLVSAEIEWPNSSIIATGRSHLYLADDRPTAPITFSYKCSRPLIFRNGSIYLELGSIQVQLNVAGKRFNDSYDCIGFTSAPIWSGVFVSFILCFAVALGLNCIMEIKPPNRFENSRGKQLTFTIQE